MIEAFTMETAHLLGDALPRMLRLRHRVFVERQNYQVPTLRGMEWDQFDTPATVYLVWRDEAGCPRGIGRLIPTTFPYMIRELWPDMVRRDGLPARSDVWELSRLGVDHALPPHRRRQAIAELMCGCGEFAINHNITSVLFVTHEKLVKNAIMAAGWPTEILGPPRRLGRFPVVAARAWVTDDGLSAARRFHGVSGPVLRLAGGDRLSAAA